MNKKLFIFYKINVCFMLLNMLICSKRIKKEDSNGKSYILMETVNNIIRIGKEMKVLKCKQSEIQHFF